METTQIGRAFDDLYRSFADDVFRFLLYLSGKWALSQDLTSETFVRVWTSTTPLRVSTAKAYLFVIARNLYLDSLRRKRPDGHPAAGWAEPASPAVCYEQREELAQTLEDMEQIVEGDRAAFAMSVLEEMSHEEVAGALGIGVGAVKSRIFRTRLRLIELSEERKTRRPQ